MLMKLAEVFSPGEYLKDELEARGWTQTQFAQIIGRPIQVVNEIIKERKSITAQTAASFAAAFGTSPELWMNLETAWQLSKVQVDPNIAKRAQRARPSKRAFAAF
jgi:HTH-type transcriptional regulator / antitoxin HigA